jgi:transposase
LESPDPTHDCAWRTEAVALRQVVANLEAQQAEQAAKLTAVLARVEQLERRLFGKKSEKMPRPEDELRKQQSEEEAEARRLAALARRKAREALRQKLHGQTVIHHVSEQDRLCPSCGGTADSPLGDGKRTTMYDYVPGYFVRQEHLQGRRSFELPSCRAGLAPTGLPASGADGR